MACASVTNTEKEIAAETWMLDFFRKQPYFQTYPERCGLFPIPGDPLHRNTVWALVKCDGSDNEEQDGKAPENDVTAAEDKNAALTAVQAPTVIFMGHHDVVPADVYGDAAPWAFDLDNIAAHLNKENLSAEAYTDLLSGEWLFGRGCCDMLGGTAVQMALLAEQAEKVLQKTDKSEKTQNEKNVMADKPVKTLRPNPDEAVVDDGDEEELYGPGKADTCGALLFLSVPDEESFSAGMRGSLSLLEGLKEKFNLDYRLAICAEPRKKNLIWTTVWPSVRNLISGWPTERRRWFIPAVLANCCRFCWCRVNWCRWAVTGKGSTRLAFCHELWQPPKEMKRLRKGTGRKSPFLRCGCTSGI